MSSNFPVNAASDYPWANQNAQYPEPTTAELRGGGRLARPTLPDWGEMTGDSYKTDADASSVNDGFSTEAYGMRPLASYRLASPSLRNFGDEEVRSLQGMDIEHETYQGIPMWQSLPAERPTAPRRAATGPELTVAGALGAQAGSAGTAISQVEAATSAKTRPSRSCRWVILGAVVGVVGAAVGAGVYFGKVRPDSMRNASSTGAGTDPSSAYNPYTTSTIFLSNATSTSFTYTPITAPSASTSPSSAVVSGRPGALADGSYNVVMSKTIDPCPGILKVVYNATLTDVFKFATSQGNYFMSYNNGKDVFNVGAANNGVLNFKLPSKTLRAANSCNYTADYDFTLNLSPS